jgi:hypothetical protein
MKSTHLGKMDRQIQRTAQLQSQAVDELAARSSEASVAKLRVAQNADELQGLLMDADARLRKLTRPFFSKLTYAWHDMSQAIQCISERLRQDADRWKDCGIVDTGIDDSSSKNFVEDSGESCSQGGHGAKKDEQTFEALASSAQEETAVAQVDLGITPASHIGEETAVARAAEPHHFRIGGLTDDSASDIASSSDDSEATNQGDCESSCPYSEFVAGLSQGPLGLKLAWPPGKVKVLSIVQGGWADQVGITEGSEVVAVNGEPVGPMQESKLRELVQLRPLRIAVIPAEHAAVASRTSRDRV